MIRLKVAAFERSEPLRCMKIEVFELYYPKGLPLLTNAYNSAFAVSSFFEPKIMSIFAAIL